MLLEAIERSELRAIAERSEPGDAHVDADCTGGLRHRLLNLSLGLDADEPLAARQAYRAIAQHARHLARQPHPAQLGQKNPTIGQIELELLRIWITKAVALAALGKLRERCTLCKEIPVCPPQVLQGMLQRMNRGIFEPRRSEPLRHPVSRFDIAT